MGPEFPGCGASSALSSSRECCLGSARLLGLRAWWDVSRHIQPSDRRYTLPQLNDSGGLAPTLRGWVLTVHLPCFQALRCGTLPMGGTRLSRGLHYGQRRVGPAQPPSRRGLRSREWSLRLTTITVANHHRQWPGSIREPLERFTVPPPVLKRDESD